MWKNTSDVDAISARTNARMKLLSNKIQHDRIEQRGNMFAILRITYRLAPKRLSY